MSCIYDDMGSIEINISSTTLASDVVINIPSDELAANVIINIGRCTNNPKIQSNDPEQQQTSDAAIEAVAQSAVLPQSFAAEPSKPHNAKLDNKKENPEVVESVTSIENPFKFGTSSSIDFSDRFSNTYLQLNTNSAPAYPISLDSISPVKVRDADFTSLAPTSDHFVAEWSGHSDIVNSLCVSPDGQFVYTASADKSIKKWDTSSGACLSTWLEHKSSVVHVCISPDGQYLYSSSNDLTVKKWGINSIASLNTWIFTSKSINHIIVSPNNQNVAFASGDNTIKMFNVSTNKFSSTLKGHADEVRCLCISPDSDILYSCSNDCTIKKWSLKFGSFQANFVGHASKVNRICLSYDNRLIYSSSDDYEIRKWDTMFGSCLLKVSHMKRVYDLCIRLDNLALYIANDDGIINVIDSSLNSASSPWSGSGNSSICVSTDGKFVFSAAKDNKVNKWKA